MNFKILWDSDWLVNIEDEFELGDKEKLKKIIEKNLFTPAGRQIAKEKYLQNFGGKQNEKSEKKNYQN